MENENKDFFDYDSYIKSKGKKKNNKKKSHSVQNEKKNKAPAAEKTHSTEDKLDKIKEEGRESIENIKKMFDDALSENAAEMAELVTEEVSPEIPVVSMSGSKKYLILGIVISIFTVIGIISTLSFSVDKIKAFADNTQQKNEFAKFIYPIVICDPAPFDQTVKLRSDTLITAAMWDIILYEDKSKYERDFDYLIIPEVDVEKHATKLFGEGLSFEHQSILNTEIGFYYEEDKSSYRIPSNPRYFTYSPYIENIERVGERYTLTVGYVSPSPAWLSLTSEEEPTPEKYVEYVVSKRGDEYTLMAISQPEHEKMDTIGL